MEEEILRLSPTAPSGIVEYQSSRSMKIKTIELAKIVNQLKFTLIAVYRKRDVSLDNSQI